MRDAETLRSLAMKFRKLAEDADPSTAADLRAIADDCEREAQAAGPDAEPPLPTGE